MPAKKIKPGLADVESKIIVIHGQKVILDSDLANLYGVETRRLNEQVRRNLRRFPPDFSFVLKNQEVKDLISQIATSSSGTLRHGGRRKNPRVFTEHGAVMAANILNSAHAVGVSIFVVRAFLKLRELSLLHKEIGSKLDALERKVTGHDQVIGSLIKAIRDLTRPPEPQKRRSIGFAPWEENL